MPGSGRSRWALPDSAFAPRVVRSIVVGVACAVAAGIVLPLDAAAQVCPTPTEQETMALLNQRRLEAGVPALPVDVRLVLSARRHSEDMAGNDFFSHVGSTGSSFVQRILDAGYPAPRSENIAAGYLSPAAVVEAWMGSPGHRQNILDPVARHMGVGFAVNAASTYKRYWTTDYGMSQGPAQGPPLSCMVLTVSANQSQFSPGQTLSLSLVADTSGSTGVADLFLGVLLPDGHTVLFFTDLALDVEIGDVSRLADWRPMAAGINVVTPFALTWPDFLSHTWTGEETPGTYTIFLAALAPGALADGQADAWEVLAVSATSFVFTP